MQEKSSNSTNGTTCKHTEPPCRRTKMAVAFANIFMGEIEKQILNESAHKPLAWKRCIDDIISLWHTSRDVVEKFIEQGNKHPATIKFRAGISCTDATFLDITIYKGQCQYNGRTPISSTQTSLSRGHRAIPRQRENPSRTEQTSSQREIFSDYKQYKRSKHQIHCNQRKNRFTATYLQRRPTRARNAEN